jgi:hypothetical protein
MSPAPRCGCLKLQVLRNQRRSYKSEIRNRKSLAQTLRPRTLC